MSQIESENIVVVPGNHDVRWGVPQDERFVTYRNLYRLFYHDLPASDDYFSRVRVFQIDNKPSVAVVGLDSCVIESSESPGIGYIGASQMERALSELHEKTEGCECFKIAVLHHHLIPVTSLRDLPNSENGEHISLVADAASVLSQMQREGFNLILHGHQHQPFFSRLIYGASNGEESHLAPLAIMGMGSAGVRIENKPNYYASIEINRSSTWEASVSWYRSEADPENTFVSDRQFSVAW
jgi:3',5'-cyclic AMP phosphodiesterase CpdA